MSYEMRMRGAEKWWAVFMLAPIVIVCLAGVVFGAINANGDLVLAALVGMAVPGWFLWYCIEIGRVYRVVFSEDAVEFATVFRRGRMARSDIAGWSRGRPNSGWPVLVVLHSKSDLVPSLELPLINGRQPEVLAWFHGLSQFEND